MARIRSTKPELCTSPQVVACSHSARLLFILMWGFCDDNGIHVADLGRLKMEVFPADALTLAQMGALITELIDQELVAEYEVSGARYWIVTGWHRHQKIDKPSFKHPLPTGEVPKRTRRSVGDKSANTPRQETEDQTQTPEETPQPVGDDSANTPGAVPDTSPSAPLRSRMESNGVESNGEENTNRQSPVIGQGNAGKAGRTAEEETAAERVARLAREKGVTEISPSADPVLKGSKLGEAK